MKQVLRTERKFLLNPAEAAYIRGRLEASLHRDSYADAEGYLVRSLYFDSVDDQDFYDKLGGEECRRKIRLRVYDPKADFAYLEMKQKQGVMQQKRSFQITKEEAMQMIQGDYSGLHHYKDVFVEECYTLMESRLYRPKTIVQYKRLPFVVEANNIRITIDSRVEATESSFDLFSEHLNLNPIVDYGNVVLEVKYSGFLLSYVHEILNVVNKSETSVSKYVLGRQQSLLTGFY